MLKGFVSGEEKDIKRIPMKVGNEYKEGWEVRDNQDRLIWGREDELQTATGTLPFKGYALPVKVKSLLGNAVQNGTPAPDNIITPEMCGVRTGNLFDYRTMADGMLGYYLDENGSELSSSSWAITGYIPCNGTSFTLNAVGGSSPAICLYDENKQLIVAQRYATGGAANKAAITITSEQTAKYIRFSWYRYRDAYDDPAALMLNPGSTALPYEPYGWKIPFENHGENLFDKSDTNLIFTGTSLATANEWYGAGGIGKVIRIPCNPSTTYTISGESDSNIFRISMVENEDIPVLEDGVVCIDVLKATLVSTQTFTTTANTKYILVQVSASAFDDYINVLMLTPGSTPKPYSPYLNETLPVYLGEVPTVRRVRKLVLDGTETGWLKNAQTVCDAFINTSIMTNYYRTNGYCSHLAVVSSAQSTSGIFFGGAVNLLMSLSMGLDTIDKFKDYLASEYAAGTPVTIWYVLANEQAATVNEPLAKIGDYADELTTIQVHGLSAPLYGIGDYKDTLNLSTGVVTRKVKKLVLTGEEAETELNMQSTNVFYVKTGRQYEYTYGKCMCTHYLNNQVKNADMNVGEIKEDVTSYWGSDSGVIVIKDSHTSLADFKAYLAAQYQNGTPVTIWYVLDTPETETVTVPTGMTGEIEGYLTQVSTPTPTNRSVPKWNGVEETGGTYTVAVYTPPEIPTTTGENTLTVETEKIHGLTNPLCGIGDYKDVLNLSTGVITRKVKKLVLTGEETWNIDGGKAGLYSATNTSLGIPAPIQSYAYQLSSHFALADSYNTIFYNTGYFAVQTSRLIISHFAYTSVESFKAFLAAQYANGTPVTIWYVLDTPETETITVPYGLECSVEGYLTQSGTPAPSSPITPDSNGILESGGTYAVEVSLVPSSLTVKGHIKELT